MAATEPESALAIWATATVFTAAMAMDMGTALSIQIMETTVADMVVIQTVGTPTMALVTTIIRMQATHT